MELKEVEKKISELLKEIRPYGKIEIAMNQDGSQISIYLTNSQKETIIIK